MPTQSLSPAIKGVKSIFLKQLESRRSKKIYVFENGNKWSYGYKMNINPLYLRTWNVILQHIGNVLQPRFGPVKKLKTRNGKKTVRSFLELERNQRYVACGKEKFKRLKNGYKETLNVLSVTNLS